MPELPEVERVRRTLEPAMAGARIERVVLNRPDLRRPFPAGFARRLRRQTIRSHDREGERCVTPRCAGRIARAWQAGRSTFYCPVCQR